MKYLPLLKKIVFEKLKVPYYLSRIDGITTGNVLSRAGLEVYAYGKDDHILPSMFKSLKEWDEITEEDVAIFVEKIGIDSILQMANS